MESDIDRGRRILDEAFELAKSIQIDIDDDYRRAIAIVEARPEFQDGTDKSWVWKMDRAFQEYFKRVRPA